MKVSIKSSLVREKVFAAIVASFQEDYQAQVGQSIAQEDITEGLSYIKTFGNRSQHQVRVCIERFVSPSMYQVSFSSNQGKQVISYELSSLDNGETVIAYDYQKIAGNLIQSINDSLLQLLFKKSMKRQIEAQLESLVRYAEG